jgi:hypothetical protein
MRAGIRAHVTALANEKDQAKKYFELAIQCLAPTPPRLIAIGGFSGTGKSSLARSIAPSFMPRPGALILRSDVIRKQLVGIDQYETLSEHDYSLEMTEKTYEQIYKDAAKALGAGHSAIADAVFARPEERKAIENVAIETGVEFDGIWLEADPTIAEFRISSRTNDASDATAEILKKQLTYDVGPLEWHRLESSADLDKVTMAAQKYLHQIDITKN